MGTYVYIVVDDKVCEISVKIVSRALHARTISSNNWIKCGAIATCGVLRGGGQWRCKDSHGKFNHGERNGMGNYKIWRPLNVCKT